MLNLRSYSVPSRRRYWIPYILLLSFTLATILLAIYLDKAADTRDYVRYESTTDQILQVIQYELDTNKSLLVSTKAFLSSSETLTQEDFTAYGRLLALQENFSGIQRLGIAERTAPDEYRVTLRYPVEGRGLTPVGTNIFLDQTRREAMERARDHGTLAATKKVPLESSNDSGLKSGFMLFAPLYEGGGTPSTLEERRSLIRGFVYGSFQSSDLFTQAAGVNGDRAVVFAIYDGGTASPERLLYSSSQLEGIRATYNPHFVSTRQIDVNGRTWTIEFATTPFFESAIEKNFTPFLFGGGLLVSILLFLFSRAQLLARQQAEQAALELQRSQLELRLKNRQITDIFESITDGFAALDRNWIFTYVNQEGARMIGHKPQEMLGRSAWEVFSDLKDTAFAKTLEETMNEGTPQAREDYYPARQAWFSIRSYPSATGLSLYFQNVTSRKHLEQQKDEFMAIASHELKTPVTSLKAFAQVLHRRFLKSGDLQSAELLGKMNTQINRLTNLIMDLLDVSKIEAGKLVLQREPFSMHSLIQEVLEELQHTTDTHSLRLSGDDATVLADRERISQVLTNLVSNAIKYSPEATTIELTTHRKTTELRVSVHDHGIGIPKEKQSHIFERFYRAGGPGQETFPGLGLGLYISAEIIRRHKGKIWVESDDGKGSVFSFSLPLEPKKSSR